MYPFIKKGGEYMTRKERQKINRQAYNKELKRIKAYIRYHEKKGEIINIQLPQRPLSYTKKEIEKLQRITPKKLKSKIRFIDIETGEIIPSKIKPKPLPKQKKTGDIKPVEYTQTPLQGLDLTSTIIDNVKDEIMKFNCKPCQSLLSLIDTIERKIGSDALASILMDSGTFLEMLQRIGNLYKAADEYTALLDTKFKEIIDKSMNDTENPLGQMKADIDLTEIDIENWE